MACSQYTPSMIFGGACAVCGWNEDRHKKLSTPGAANRTDRRQKRPAELGRGGARGNGGGARENGSANVYAPVKPATAAKLVQGTGSGMAVATRPRSAGRKQDERSAGHKQDDRSVKLIEDAVQRLDVIEIKLDALEVRDESDDRQHQVGPFTSNRPES